MNHEHILIHAFSMSSNTYSCIDLQSAEILNSKTERVSVSHRVSPFFVLTHKYYLMALMSLDIQFRDGPLKLQHETLSQSFKIMLKLESGRPHT